MPIVFSPGEAETRPLYPSKIVYTTAQKVADLLGIGVGEAIAVSADSVSDGVYVTGADYRDHGFEVGESILIYSDQNPLGIEKTITAITNGGASGIKLGFAAIANITVGGASYNNDPTITHSSSSLIVVGMGVSGSGIPTGATVSSITSATEFELSASTTGGAKSGQTLTFTSAELYQSADNTYVQNQASFTNGKTRGMKRSVVEERIKEVQDRIDNVTHNAWRPYLVVAEYINFDTYKPYRRRYYTDYVGTTPLLFRNVQQILRIELWQGANYRELAGAEARLEIVDHSELAGDAIWLCPGGGGFAQLAVGGGTQQWHAAFNKVTTAQNLADLINNEDRTNRGTVSFTTDATSPSGSTYSTADGSSATGLTEVHVHNEFLATANADYGSGKLKITSMQPAGGKESSIGITDLTNIVLTETTTAAATLQMTGPASAITITDSGSGYSNASGVATTGGSGTGLTVNISVIGGPAALATAAINAAGTGYKVGDIVTVTGGGGNAKLTITSVTNSGTVSAEDTDVELHNFADLTPYGVIMIGTGTSVEIMGYSGKTADALTGCVDLTGGAFALLSSAVTGTQHILNPDLGFISGTSGDQARLKDWWLDHEMGIIYFNNSYPFFEWNAVKVSYIYGERYVEKAIEEAATKLVACDLLMSDDRSVLIPEGTQNVDLASKIQLWRQEAERILNRYKEVVVFE